MNQKRDWPEWFSHLSLPEEVTRPAVQKDGTASKDVRPEPTPPRADDTGQQTA